jgi:hypothetical protein
MTKEKIEKDAKTATNHALMGFVTGKDLIAIIRFQMPELGPINDVEAATMVLYQVAFN